MKIALAIITMAIRIAIAKYIITLAVITTKADVVIIVYWDVHF